MSQFGKKKSQCKASYKWPSYTAPKKATGKGKTYTNKVSRRTKYDGRVGKFSRQILFKVNTWRKHSTAEAHVRRYEKEGGSP